MRNSEKITSTKPQQFEATIQKNHIEILYQISLKKP